MTSYLSERLNIELSRHFIMCFRYPTFSYKLQGCCSIVTTALQFFIPLIVHQGTYVLAVDYFL